MNLQPVLKGSRVLLRPLLETDFEDLFRTASDPLIWELHPNSDRYERHVFADYFRGAMESKGAFLILDLASNEVIGCSRYYEYAPERSEIKIGYTFIARKYWGGTYNFE